jgi:hypothetical protein
MFKEGQMHQRLKRLKEHLKQENPLLTDVIDSFRELDRIGRRLGFLDREESFANRTPWWPLISALGLYSSGKSTFINHYLERPLQATGNQAVDNKFTVICFSGEDEVRVLPGLALDADPRFPLYKISKAIEEVSPGEGQRVDAYLQLKTCASEKLRGKILIDSPGFDADAQRTSTLRITDHIIDLSDLVLVFFDARHPESGSMQDTLKHLVNGTINRRDSNKFLYILNQIDTTATEDNPEEVFAAWQRALAQHGMTAGRCYSIYNSDVALPISDAGLRSRYEHKRDRDLAEIHGRIEQVKVERSYRIVGMLEQTARKLEKEVLPRLRRFVTQWRRTTLWLDAIVFGGVLSAFLLATIWAGFWEGFRTNLPGLEWFLSAKWRWAAALIVLFAAAGYVHFAFRKSAAGRVARKLLAEVKDDEWEEHYARAFHKNTCWWRSIFRRQPAGWGRRSAAWLAEVMEKHHEFVQELNDLYTDPSGKRPVGLSREPHTETGVAALSSEPATAEEGLIGNQEAGMGDRMAGIREQGRH